MAGILFTGFFIFRMRRLILRNILKTTRAFSTQASLVDVSVDATSGIATLTMQRAPVNSLNLDLCKALLTAIQDAEKNKSRGIILTSAQATVFSAGLDILEMYKPDPARLTEFWKTLQDLWLALYGSKVATVAVINGHSPAGGCLLACSCEQRIMVDNNKYTIGLNETKLGIVAPPWFVATYQNVLPKRVAERALIAGTLFPVNEALAVGLIDEIATDKTDALNKANLWLSQFAKISPAARSMTKQTLRGDSLQWMIKNRDADLKTFVGFASSEPVQKGLGMYLESLKKKN